MLIPSHTDWPASFVLLFLNENAYIFSLYVYFFGEKKPINQEQRNPAYIICSLVTVLSSFFIPQTGTKQGMSAS